jgi:hypothetical protein
MIVPSIEIRSATQDERPRVEACIATAFVTDPIARFAIPAPDVYLRAWPLVCRAFRKSCTVETRAVQRS